MDVLIRKAKNEDLPGIYELLKCKELLDPDGKPCRKWWIKSFFKQVFLIAESELDKKVVGFIIGEKASGNLGLIHLIAVKKEFRRKGIATLLLIKAEKELKKRNAKAILVYGYASRISKRFLRKSSYMKGSKTYEFLKFI
jgi:N-acetylglutamate synthase-like GNAT family acetyltransferase